ncbi:cupin [Nesterenkonia sp. CF4.4]|uniref:cupin n=1 Tax=Nesterenkonia sp. CF4.4 TaxID=3373079 RepID=UPI003EE607FD
MAGQREKLDVRTFDDPDELFDSEMGHAERVTVGGHSVWRALAKPGWRYTVDTNGELCTAPHALYIVSGRLHVLADDGTEAEGGPGEVMVIEPGHDGWTVGDEPCVFIDFGESVQPADRS